MADPRGGFPDEAFELLARVEAGNYWFESRSRLIAWAIRTYAPGARTVLDVGCGTGFVLAHLRRTMPGLALTGCEPSAEGQRITSSRVPGARLLRMDARTLAVAETFDVVCLLDVLEHIEDERTALERIGTAVRPGGTLIVTVPQHRWLWGRADDYGHHVRRYSRGGLRRVLQQAGFDVRRMTSFVSLLLPAMMASRWQDRRKKTPYDPWRELQIDPRLNRVFGALLAFERRAIAAGLDWPAGGSLLAVARRR